MQAMSFLCSFSKADHRFWCTYAMQQQADAVGSIERVLTCSLRARPALCRVRHCSLNRSSCGVNLPFRLCDPGPGPACSALRACWA